MDESIKNPLRIGQLVLYETDGPGWGYYTIKKVRKTKVTIGRTVFPESLNEGYFEQEKTVSKDLIKVID